MWQVVRALTLGILFILHHRQAQQIKRWLQLLRDLHKACTREACLSLQLGTQQVRVDFTVKYLKQTEAALRYAFVYSLRCLTCADMTLYKEPSRRVQARKGKSDHRSEKGDGFEA